MKKKRLLKTAVAGAVALTSILGNADAAFAVKTSADANAGFDDVMDTIIGSGSDTTYLMMQRLELVYNQTPGCTLRSGPTAADRACIAAGSPDTAVTTENWDHDLVVGEFPVGSSNGVARVISGVADYGRSSRNRRTDGSEDSTVFAGYAKGALSPITFAGRPTGNLTRQNLIDIFVTCTLNNWSQLGFPAAPIRPYGVQTGSGTYLSMRDYLGGDPNTCANAIGTGRVFFENNTAPIDGGTGTDGAVYPGPAADRADAIWWMEFADIQASPSRRGTAQFWRVNNILPTPASNIANDVYPITRFMWHVNLKTQLQATGGKAGAAGAMMEWMCRNGGHGVNFNTGNNVNNDINAAINSSGFVRTPLSQGNNHPVTNVPLRCRLNFAAPF